MLRSSKRPFFEHLRLRVCDESGQSLVELAFAIPLVLLVILALVDFGLALNTWIDATQVATEGARMASVDGPKASSCTDLANRIKSTAYGGLNNGKITIAFPNGASIGQPVQVLVTAQYNYAPGGLIPNSPLNIKAQATMRLEQAVPSGTGCTST
jgi:Flp pilus assembly protein TadG